MADIKTAEARSRNMAAIKGKNTEPEVYLRKKLFAKGYRYRKNVSDIPGSPDIWMRKYNTAIFVHGCFWHRHKNCKYAYMPKSRVDFWESKFSANTLRDESVKRKLHDKGIKCLIVWECTIRKMKKNAEYENTVLKQCKEFSNSDNMYLEI